MTQPSIDPQLLAALLDGTLAPAERDRLIALLATSADHASLVADIVAVQEHAAPLAVVRPTPGVHPAVPARVADTPSRTPRLVSMLRRPVSLFAVAAAAVFTIVAWPDGGEPEASLRAELLGEPYATAWALGGVSVNVATPDSGLAGERRLRGGAADASEAGSGPLAVRVGLASAQLLGAVAAGAPESEFETLREALLAELQNAPTPLVAAVRALSPSGTEAEFAELMPALGEVYGPDAVRVGACLAVARVAARQRAARMLRIADDCASAVQATARAEPSLSASLATAPDLFTAGRWTGSADWAQLEAEATATIRAAAAGDSVGALVPDAPR